MQLITIVENFFIIHINNFIYLMYRLLIQIAVTRANFTRTSVTDPSVTRHSNSMPTKVLLGAPKEVITTISIYFTINLILKIPNVSVQV